MWGLRLPQGCSGHQEGWEIGVLSQLVTCSPLVTAGTVKQTSQVFLSSVSQLTDGYASFLDAVS